MRKSKYSNLHKVSKSEENDLFILFAELLSKLSSTVAAANFIKGVLTEQEVLTISRRFKVVQMLGQDYDYKAIRQQLKMSDATIAKIQAWMRTFPDGFEHVLRNNHKPKTRPNFYESSWRQHKRRYPMYYWPQLLLEEVVRSANKRESERLLKIIGQMREKTKLTRQLEHLLKK